MPVGGHVKGQKRALSLSLRGAGFATKQSPMRRWGLLRHTTPRNDRGKFLSSRAAAKQSPKFAVWRWVRRHKTPSRNDQSSYVLGKKNEKYTAVGGSAALQENGNATRRLNPSAVTKEVFSGIL